MVAVDPGVVIVGVLETAVATEAEGAEAAADVGGVRGTAGVLLDLEGTVAGGAVPEGAAVALVLVVAEERSEDACVPTLSFPTCGAERDELR